ncbi:FAD-dependent oxidoreductase [Gymnodinialimonas sp. 2305UL16-5]|uniref:FAD-dependent oxidoreductase n=1 Tax=Gymnodinialimonas mytili TaxID=3126503 RepID=UPI0030AB9E6A
MIRIAGAGLAGLTSALELARRGAKVTVYDRASGPGKGSVARYAGGMLAPWCERESADDAVVTLGRDAVEWWSGVTAVTRLGTLVVAPPRDRQEVARFARRTSDFTPVDGAGIAELEPALGGRFDQGLHFTKEAHLNPRQALIDLTMASRDAGVSFRWATEAPAGVTLDCTGPAANLPGLRPVRGEMAILQCPEVEITRTVRLLHPRIPLYLVPRGAGIYMIGATMIESSSTRPPTLRSISELLSAAFTLHPGFAEASILEIGAGLRPAYGNNLPRLTRHGGGWALNGLYRHGFLLAPAMAKHVADTLLSETSHEHPRECPAA